MCLFPQLWRSPNDNGGIFLVQLHSIPDNSVVRSLVSFHLKKMIQNCMAVLSPKKLTKRRPFMPVSTPHIGVPWCSLLSGSTTLQRKGFGPQLASSKAKNTGNYTASEGNVVWKPVATKKPTQKWKLLKKSNVTLMKCLIYDVSLKMWEPPPTRGCITSAAFRTVHIAIVTLMTSEQVIGQQMEL